MNDETNLVDQWTARIREAFELEDQVVVASLLEVAILETDSSPKLLEIAGMIEYSHGNVDEAIRLIGTAMFEIGLSISGQLTIANAWLDKGDKASARTTLLFLVEMIEHVPCSMLPDLAHSLASINEFEAAIDVCRTGFERHPSDDNAVFGAAYYMYRAGYPLQLVYSSMAKAVELAPQSHLYRLNIAVVCCSLERWQEGYGHACRIPLKALVTVPCACMKAHLKKLFHKFNDDERLSLVNEAN